MIDSADATQAALSVAGLSKSFGATRALQEFSFEFQPGRAYALVGENGSGKSTLVKMLCGVLPPDSGTVMIGGNDVTHFSPRAAISAGIATCHQEILVEDNLSTLDNLFLWDRGWLKPRIAGAARRAAAAATFEQLSLNPPPLDWRVEHLSLAARQLVVIARTLLQQGSVLLFDEVTAALDQSDAERVLAAIRARVDAGATVLFTTHRMEELQRLGDEIVVLRNGQIAGVLSSSELTASGVLTLMSGRSVAAGAAEELQTEPSRHAPAVPQRSSDSQGDRRREAQPAPALRLRDVRLRAGAAPLQLEIGWGDVTGLAGLDGHGQSELLKLMGGVLPAKPGTVELESGSDGFVPIGGQRHAVELGVTYLPRDRKTEGIFPTLSVLDNFALPTASARTRLGFVSRQQTTDAYDPLAGRLAIKTASRDAGISSLSGGNQQKVLIARWLAADPRVVLLDDPTRGVDIGTKLDLYRLLRELAVEGRAVVLVSTELEELASVCDRVVVVHNHSVSADLRRSDAPIEREEILSAMIGNWEMTA